MKYAVKCGQIPGRKEDCLICEDGKILSIGIFSEMTEQLNGIEIKRLDNYTMMPGFIDSHIHGSVGIDVGTCDLEGLLKMAENLALHGVTSFLPTIPAAHPEQNRAALSVIQQGMAVTASDGRYARVLGCHMEGPFMMEKCKGALDASAFCDANTDNWEALVGPYESVVKRITMDPLRPGVLSFIPYLTARGITVSLGHTDADAETMDKAFAAGAVSVTHLFNAMSGLHHRKPGAVGAALASDDCYCELILDFLHVFPHAVKAAIKAKGPGKIVAITDACEAAGMPDGRYVLGGRAVNVVNGEARLPEGNLASSTVFMDRELNNLLSLGFSPADCVRMTSENPAALIPNCETGRLEEGCLFDAVFLDSEWQVRGTAIGGRLNMHQ